MLVEISDSMSETDRLMREVVSTEELPALKELLSSVEM